MMNDDIDMRDRGMSNPENPFVPADRHRNAGKSSESGSSCYPGAYPSQQGPGLGWTYMHEMSQGNPGRMFGIPPPPGFQPNGMELAPAPGPGGPMSLPCTQQSWGYPASVQPMDSRYTFYGSQDVYPNPTSNWDTFEETCSQPMFPVGINTGHQGIGSFQLPPTPGPRCDNWEMGPNFNIGNYGGGYGGNPPAVGIEEERYHMQIGQHRALPLDVHQKIRSMPGCIIIDYFEVSLVRFRNETIVESNPCFAVYTKKPETGQHWLTAFAVKEHFRTVIKFNRLLTSHLKVKVNGPTAVELQPSKLSPVHAGETYLFNFEHAETAKLFLDLLHGARSQIWSRELVDPNQVMRDAQQSSRFHASDFNSGDRSGFAQGALFPRNRSFKPGRDNVLDSPLFRGSLEGTIWERKGHTKEESTTSQEVEGGPVTFEEKDVKFKTNGKLFVRCSDNEPLACVGEGEICVIQGENYYDKMVFVSKSKKEVICHHYIYHWNTIKETKKNDENFASTWMASAILGNTDAEIPSLLQIKLEIESEEKMSNFCEVMSESNIKGKTLARSAAIH